SAETTRRRARARRGRPYGRSRPQAGIRRQEQRRFASRFRPSKDLWWPWRSVPFRFWRRVFPEGPRRSPTSNLARDDPEALGGLASPGALGSPKTISEPERHEGSSVLLHELIHVGRGDQLEGDI